DGLRRLVRRRALRSLRALRAGLRRGGVVQPGEPGGDRFPRRPTGMAALPRLPPDGDPGVGTLSRSTAGEGGPIAGRGRTHRASDGWERVRATTLTSLWMTRMRFGAGSFAGSFERRAQARPESSPT